MTSVRQGDTNLSKTRKQVVTPKWRGQELLHLTFTTTMPALRRMLKAPTEDVFRTALRVMAHYVRYLAPHCEVWTLGLGEVAFFWALPRLEGPCHYKMIFRIFPTSLHTYLRPYVRIYSCQRNITLNLYQVIQSDLFIPYLEVT